MFKALILTWSILANTVGAHGIATTITEPITARPVAKVQAANSAELLGKLPIPINVPRLKNTAKPDIQAYSYLAYDTETGTVLVEKNGYDARAIASTAKLMTAYLVIQKNKLDDIVTVSKAAASHPGSTMALRNGESITVKNLLYGLILNSGNDAAQALAEYNGGVDAFVNDMNAKAKELGLTKSHFTEPAGYDEEGTQMSSFDLAKLMKVVMNTKALAPFFQTKDIVVANTSGSISHRLSSSNRLLKNDFGIWGGKTGTGTFDKNKAGHVMVTGASRNGHAITAVVANTYFNRPESSAVESAKLLSFVFDNL